MTRIIGIGGGELRERETLPLDRAIVSAASCDRPKVLFIPTASADSYKYWEAFRELYGQELNCQTDVLFLIRENPQPKTILKKIEWANIIYVGGGNSRLMLTTFKQLKVDKILYKAGKQGKILSGISAGAICWFRYGNSDAPLLENCTSSLGCTTRVDGLDLVNATLCPHMSSEPYRWQELPDMMQDTPGVCIALDDHCAIDIFGENYRIIGTRTEVAAHKVYWRNNKIHKEVLPATVLSNTEFRFGVDKGEGFKPLKELLGN